MTHSDTKKQYWSNHIESWKTSELSQEKYCKQHGISYAAFGYWRSRLLKESSHSHKREAHTPTFKQAIIKPYTQDKPKPVMSVIKIVLPNQTMIELPSSLIQSELTAIFQALGALS